MQYWNISVITLVAVTIALIVTIIAVLTIGLMGHPAPIPGVERVDLDPLRTYAHPSRHAAPDLEIAVQRRDGDNFANALINDVTHHGGVIVEMADHPRRTGARRAITLSVPSGYLENLRPLAEHGSEWVHPGYADWVRQIINGPIVPTITGGDWTQVRILVYHRTFGARWVSPLLGALTVFTIGSTVALFFKY